MRLATAKEARLAGAPSGLESDDPILPLSPRARAQPSRLVGNCNLQQLEAPPTRFTEFNRWLAEARRLIEVSTEYPLQY